jgi:hypothetical protein
MNTGRQQTIVEQAENMIKNSFQKSRTYLIPPIQTILQLYNYHLTKTHIGFREDTPEDAATRQDFFKVIVCTFFNQLHKLGIDYNEYAIVLGLEVVSILQLHYTYNENLRFNSFYCQLRDSIIKFINAGE